MSDILEYLTRSHKVLRFDKSYAACAPFGFFNGQRVQTPKGPGTVVGVHTTPAGEKQMWFHVDGQDGASFWDNGTDHDSLVKDVGVTALEPPPEPPVARASGSSGSSSPASQPGGVQPEETQPLDRLTGMFSTLDATVCLDALRGADGNVNTAVERLLNLTSFQQGAQPFSPPAERPQPAAVKPVQPVQPVQQQQQEQQQSRQVSFSPAPASDVQKELARDLLSSSTDTVDDEEEPSDDADLAARDEHLRKEVQRQVEEAAAAAIARSDGTGAGFGVQVQVPPVAGTQDQQHQHNQLASPPASSRAALVTSNDDLTDMLTRMKALQEENARVEAEKRTSMTWCISQVEKSLARLKERDMLIARLETENAQLKGEVQQLRSKQTDLMAKSQAMLDSHIRELTQSFAQLVTDSNGDGSDDAAKN
jgi:hypothetical protein